VTDESTIVVYAVGGNALSDPTSGEPVGLALAAVVEDIIGLSELGHRIVLTHGNGPQVGRLLVMEERARRAWSSDANGASAELQVEQRTGIHAWVAATQSMMGERLASSLESAFSARDIEMTCTVLTTRVEVDRRDPGFASPSKPVGIVLTDDADVPSEWHIGQTAVGRRRLVASPRPIRILEEDAIRALLMQDGILICAGGGGIPVTRHSSGQYRGVDAVVDKDRTSGLLAGSLNAAAFIITTAIDSIRIDFGRPTESAIDELPLLDAIKMVEEGVFPPGSMGPKVEAMVRAKRLHPRMVVALCSPGHAIDALEGRAGTRIVTGWGDLLTN